MPWPDWIPNGARASSSQKSKFPAKCFCYLRRFVRPLRNRESWFMEQTEQKLRKILELTRTEWDHPTTRPAVRENFQRVCHCRTPVLGGEVYESATEEMVFYHTCKSKCCPSCGNRGTQLWQREQWCALPDIPFVGIVLTMPDVFWPIFRSHRHLQHDLSSSWSVHFAILGMEAIPRASLHDCGAAHVRWSPQPSPASPHHGIGWWIRYQAGPMD